MIDLDLHFELGPPPRFGIDGFARLFEGEGSVVVARKRQYRALRLQMGSTDADVIAAVHEEFGGTVCTIHRPDRPGNQPFHQWTLCGVAAADLALAMLPFLFSRRRRQVYAAVEEWKAFRRA